MLKLTEAELAEMGFRRDYHGYAISLGEYSGKYIGIDDGRWSVSDADSISYCHPQTKEDLLTLIRLFTPPREVKDAS